jgi:hypothetical protein
VAGDARPSVARRIGRTITNAASLVEQQWPAIRRVANALISDRVLSEAEIDELTVSRVIPALLRAAVLTVAASLCGGVVVLCRVYSAGLPRRDWQ